MAEFKPRRCLDMTGPFGPGKKASDTERCDELNAMSFRMGFTPLIIGTPQTSLDILLLDHGVLVEKAIVGLRPGDLEGSIEWTVDCV